MQMMHSCCTELLRAAVWALSVGASGKTREWVSSQDDPKVRRAIDELSAIVSVKMFQHLAAD